MDNKFIYGHKAQCTKKFFDSNYTTLFTVNDFVKYCGYSYNTAWQLIDRNVSIGLIEKIGSHQYKIAL